MKPGDLVVFDADIVKRIFPTGLFDGDMGTIVSECTLNDLKKRSGPVPYYDHDTPIWWVQWWTGDYAGRKRYCEEKFLRVVEGVPDNAKPQ